MISRKKAKRSATKEGMEKMHRKFHDVEKEVQRAADKKRKENMQTNVNYIEKETLCTTA